MIWHASLRQGWILAPLLFNTFKADKAFMDALLHLRKTTGVIVVV